MPVFGGATTINGELKMNLVKSFTSNESGAVTVDWVVLTAAIVGIAIAVLTVVSGGLNSASNTVNDQLNSASTNSAIAGAIAPTAGGAAGAATGGAMTASQFMANAGGNYNVALTAISLAAPAGFQFNGFVDTATGTPIYDSLPQNGAVQSVSVNGQTMPTDTYLASSVGITPF